MTFITTYSVALKSWFVRAKGNEKIYIFSSYPSKFLAGDPVAIDRFIRVKHTSDTSVYKINFLWCTSLHKEMKTRKSRWTWVFLYKVWWRWESCGEFWAKCSKPGLVLCGGGIAWQDLFVQTPLRVPLSSEIKTLLSSRYREGTGQKILPEPAVSQTLSAWNTHCTRVAYMGVACPELCQNQILIVTSKNNS